MTTAPLTPTQFAAVYGPDTPAPWALMPDLNAQREKAERVVLARALHAADTRNSVPLCGALTDLYAAVDDTDALNAAANRRRAAILAVVA